MTVTLPDATGRAARLLLADYAAGDDTAADALSALTVGTVAGFGTTADTIAATFIRRRITGHPGDSEQNPLSRALAAALGASTVAVREYRFATLTFTGVVGEELCVEGIELPGAVAGFLTGFAEGRWEVLVDRDVRPIRTWYLRSDARDLHDVQTITRGSVVCSAERGGSSDPIPDDLIAAIGTAGLHAEDYADEGYTSLRLYQGDLCVGMIRGGDLRFVRYGDIVMVCESGWNVCAGYQYCPRVNIHTRFTDRDEALHHVLAHLGDICQDHREDAGAADLGGDDAR